MAKNTEQTEERRTPVCLPAIPLRGLVIFPGLTAGFEIGRPLSVEALRKAAETENRVFLIPQNDAEVEDPGAFDLAGIGVVAAIVNVLRLTSGNYQVIAEGLFRAERGAVEERDGCLFCEAKPCESDDSSQPRGKRALQSLWKTFNDFLQYTVRPSDDILDELKKIDEPGMLADFLASNYIMGFEDRFFLLQELDPVCRAEQLNSMFGKRIAMMELESSIQAKVRYRMTRRQRDAFLREQMNTIRGELGMDEEMGEYGESDGGEYLKRIAEADLPEEVGAKLREEAEKLSKMPFGTAEATVIGNYLDVCLSLPWKKYSDDRLDVREAEAILNEDHDGIEKVKERILEFLSVKQLKPDAKGQILCLVGPPGVGKTSVAKSVARATNRAFARVSLGGIRDEAEIRGHRKTYIGAMPGRIIDAVKQAGTANPVILLDELDKLTSDVHGDPSSALLEALDGEQNNTFRDHFLELPFDLSKVMFIATANTTETIPPALLDRLEVIEMNSYTDTEKLAIAFHHLIPKELANHGLTKRQLHFTEDAVRLLITGYTHENGVRNLQRCIASVCRKTARKLVTGDCKVRRVTADTVKKDLGPVKYLPLQPADTDEIGIVNGLAWTTLGGELLRVEARSMQGTGKLELTGSLGDVMKESARTAVSYIRKHSGELGVDPEFYSKQDVHIHVPEGATPKDGPSAGVTLCTALFSELTNRPVKRNVAMTGEITLSGKVLPIGGLREKTMAAYKNGCDTVIIPFDNQGDIEELDGEVREHLRLIPVKTISEVLSLATDD